MYFPSTWTNPPALATIPSIGNALTSPTIEVGALPVHKNTLFPAFFLA